MKKSGLLSFVHKETLHIVRDVRTMMIVLLMPVVLMLLFGFAISTEINSIKVAVVAPNRTESIRQAVERISSNPYFELTDYIDAQDADCVLRRGDADVVITFAADYDRLVTQHLSEAPSQSAVLLSVDASDTNVASAAEVYLQNLLTSDNSMLSMFDMHLLYNPQMKSAYNFVPGIMGLIFILICAMMTSVSIVREKETGTMEVLLVSPVRPLKIIVAKMIPYFVLSCVNLTTILLIARYVLSVPMTGGVVSVVVLSLLYILLSLSLGLLISTMVDTQAVAMLISAMVMLMPIMLLSGMVFPIENMPSVLQPLTTIVPARWYIAAVRKVMIEGLSFASVVKEFTILLAMTVAIVAVSLKKFNDKLE